MIRDELSNALLETDTIALDKYRQEKRRNKQLMELAKEVAFLKDQIKMIQEILSKHIEEKN